MSFLLVCSVLWTSTGKTMEVTYRVPNTIHTAWGMCDRLLSRDYPTLEFQYASVDAEYHPSTAVGHAARR